MLVKLLNLSVCANSQLAINEGEELQKDVTRDVSIGYQRLLESVVFMTSTSFSKLT